MQRCQFADSGVRRISNAIIIQVQSLQSQKIGETTISQSIPQLIMAHVQAQQGIHAGPQFRRQLFKIVVGQIQMRRRYGQLEQTLQVVSPQYQLPGAGQPGEAAPSDALQVVVTHVEFEQSR